jgi:hypothetical protein
VWYLLWRSNNEVIRDFQWYYSRLISLDQKMLKTLSWRTPCLCRCFLLYKHDKHARECIQCSNSFWCRYIFLYRLILLFLIYKMADFPPVHGESSSCGFSFFPHDMFSVRGLISDKTKFLPWKQPDTCGVVSVSERNSPGRVCQEDGAKCFPLFIRETALRK